MKNLIFHFLLLNLLLLTTCVKVNVEIKTDTGEMTSTPKSRLGRWIDQNNLDSLDPFLEVENKGLKTQEPGFCPAKEKGRAEALAQQTDVWCWATSAQTVMKFHGRKNLEQCKIVNDILGRGVINSGGVETPFCCGTGVSFPGTGLPFPGECWINGWPEWALESHNFYYELSSSFLQPDKLASQLCKNGPIIFILLYKTNSGGHTLVVEDYEVDKNRKKMLLWVYDHSWIDRKTSGGIQRIPKEYELWPYEDFAEGWWNGEQHIHDSDIVQIHPL